MDYNLSYFKPKKKSPSSRVKNFLYHQYYSNVIKSKQKSRSYYQKIYNVKSETSFSENGINNKNKFKPKKSKIYSTEKVLQKTFQKKSVNTSVIHWPKITHPKLPFSKRIILDPEEKKQKILKLKPSLLFHDFYTIQWLRKKYGNSNIEKSIYTLLPNNGKPVIPDDENEKERRHRLTMEFLQNSNKKEENIQKFANINPKYLFDQTTFEKILKLKEIFLEFDEDDSRKMEIDEMVKMFNDNHIYANIDELVNLFFKDKKYKKEDIMSLYLDFYQFMNFALTKDQDFRNFMRGIKKKINNNKTETQKQGYLPMSFNLVLDYFIAKGKERSSIEIIENAMNEIDKIIETNQKKKNQKIRRGSIFGESATQINALNNNNIKKSLILTSNMQPVKSVSSNNNKRHSVMICEPIFIDDYQKEIEKYDEQFKKINFCELITEFSKLFKAATISTSEFAKIIPKKIQSNSVDINNNFKRSSGLPSSILLNDGEHMISEQECENSNLYINTLTNEVSIKDLIKRQMDKNKIKEMNFMNYDKFHNIQIALDTTKQQLNSFGRNRTVNKKIKNISNLNKSINNTLIDIHHNRYISVSNNDIKNIHIDKKNKPINLFLNKSKINNRYSNKININRTQFQEYEFRKNNISRKLRNKKLKTYVSYYAGVPHIMNNEWKNNNYSNISINSKKKPKNDYVPMELMK